MRKSQRKYYICTAISLSLLGVGGFSLANQITFDSRLETHFPGYTEQQALLHFDYGSNDMEGLLFPTALTQISPAVDVVLNGSTRSSCRQQVQGLYYANARGARIRPLDLVSLHTLRTIDTGYNNMTLSGGLFFDCDNRDEAEVYGQVTVSLYGQSYKLIAGTDMDFAHNTYNNDLEETLRVHNETLSGHLFDNYGGVARVGRMLTGVNGREVELTLPEDNQIIAEGSVAFRWTSNLQADILEDYQILVSRDRNFGSLEIDATTEQLFFTQNLTEAGTYYRKIRAKDTQGNTQESEVQEFHIEVPTENYPSKFAIQVPKKGFVEIPIPIYITALNGDTVETDYEGDILIKLEDEDGDLVSTSKYQVPHDGIYTFDEDDKGLFFDAYNFIIEEPGTYTIRVEDVQYGERVYGEKQIQILSSQGLFFQHEEEVSLDKRIVSHKAEVPSFVKENTKISVSLGEIIVGGVNKGKSTTVSPGDTVQIALQSPDAYDKTVTSLVTLGSYKYTFGLTTRTRYSDDEDDIFGDEVPEISNQHKEDIGEVVEKLFEVARKRNYDMRAFKMKLVIFLDTQLFLTDSNTRHYYKQRIINREKFKASVYEAMKEAILQYQIQEQVFTHDAYKYSFRYPRASTIQKQGAYTHIKQDETTFATVFALVSDDALLDKVQEFYDDLYNKIGAKYENTEYIRENVILGKNKSFGIYNSHLIVEVIQKGENQRIISHYYLKNKNMLYKISYDNDIVSAQEYDIKVFKDSFRMQ